MNGQYEFVNSIRTQPENVLQSLANEPVMFHMYKRGDFQSKSVEKIQDKTRKQEENLKKMLHEAINDEFRSLSYKFEVQAQKKHIQKM